MSDLYQQTIPNLISGVSQQAPALRRVSECESQENCRNDPVEGMGKRFNTVEVGEVDGITDPQAYTYANIERDDNERYKVAIKNGDVRVFDLETAEELTVVPDDGAIDYLAVRGSLSADEAFSMTNIVDTTLILNRTVPVKRLPYGGDMTPPAPTAARVLTIDIERHRRPVAENYVDYYYYIFTIDGTEYKYSAAQDSLTQVTSQVRTWLSQEYPGTTFVHVGEGTITAELGVGVEIDITGIWHYQWDSGGGEDVEWVIVEGDCVSTSEELQNIPAPSPLVPSAIWYVKQADYLTEYHVELDGVDNQIKTPDPTSTAAREGLRTLKLASDMVTAINGNTGSHGCVATLYNNIVYIQKADNSDFTIASHDDLSNNGSYAIKEWVADFGTLPPSAPEGYILEVRGEPSANVEPYYVEYTELDDDGDNISGIWKETIAPHIPSEFDLRTMPHSLTRAQDAAYITAENPLGIYFKLHRTEFAPKTVGDKFTAPFPSFVSEQDDDGHVVTPRYIQAMGLYSNRLIMCSDTNLVASTAGEFLNFFPSTVLSVLPGDMFDVSMNLTTVEPIKHLVPYADELFLMSNDTQLRVTHGDAFTAETIDILNAANYEIDTAIKPFVEGQYIHMFNRGKDYSALMEFGPVPGDEEKYKADGVTDHVPRYIEGQVVKVVTSTINKQMFILTRSLGGALHNHLYVYNYLWKGSEKVQNAWQKWTFDGYIADIHMHRDELQLMKVYFNEYGDDVDHVYFESMDLTFDILAEELGHPVYLDRRKEVDENFTLNATDGRVIREFDGRYFVGYPFTQKYVFSEQYFRDSRTQRPMTGGKLQLRYLELVFNDTTQFDVLVERKARDDHTESFTGRRVGSIGSILGEIPVVSGKKRIPLMANSLDVTVTILNDSVYDAVFQTADIEGTYFNRARRI